MFKISNVELRQKFNIKYFVDFGAFLFAGLLFLVFGRIKHIATYDTLVFLAVVFVIIVSITFITKQWALKTLETAITNEKNSMSDIYNKTREILDVQKTRTDILKDQVQKISELIGKLIGVSETTVSMSQNTEKQVNQSISFSQKEHESIASNADRMITLRQKIQMIAELVLELSEHTQQIGSTINVVDDIAEQTNMLALNAAVEAARAGEHGKGFAVVAGEIRKLADESKQAITKITSLTSNIQYTTNSTVMATEEGSKEIEAVVKDINALTSNSETMLNLIKDIFSSLDSISKNAQIQKDIVDQLKVIESELNTLSVSLSDGYTNNIEKI